MYRQQAQTIQEKHNDLNEILNLRSLTAVPSKDLLTKSITILLVIIVIAALSFGYSLAKNF